MNIQYKIFKPHLILLLSIVLKSTIAFSQLSGVITVGNNPNKSYDFQTIQSAFDSLHKVGVAGPITIKIDTGFYHEKVHIASIPNVNQFNNIVVESLSPDSSQVVVYSSLNYIFEGVFTLDSIKHITIKNLTIKADIALGFGGIKYTILLLATDSIYLFNNHIIANQSNGDSIIGILNNSNYCEIINNRIEDGLISIINGDNYPIPKNKIISHNFLINFSLIGIEGTQKCIITQNKIHSDIGVLGISNTESATIENNEIINTQFGIHLLDNSPTLIYNNMVRMNRPNTKNSFLLVSSLSNTNVFFNTVFIENGLNTSVTAP